MHNIRNSLFPSFLLNCYLYKSYITNFILIKFLYLVCKELEIRTVLKDANGASTFRISSGIRSPLLSKIHVDPIGPGTDNIKTYVDNFTGEKTRHGSCFKERQWYQ